MSVPIDDLPQNVGEACIRLSAGLSELLGDELVALWVYGAVTFPDRPARLGDVDTHGVLRSRPEPGTARAIDELHESIAQASDIEWDSWYILASDAERTEPPHHVLRSNLVDDAWALHRAHWLAGRFVALHGRPPAELVREPSWTELEQGLDGELEYIEDLLDRGRNDARHAAFMVWNACRILYSLRTHDVVVSKRTAAHWALDDLPGSWSEAISAAERVYDGCEADGDADALRAALPAVVGATRAQLRRV